VTTPGGSYAVIRIADDYVRIQGIEIDGSGVTGSTSWVYGIRVDTSVIAAADIRIDKVERDRLRPQRYRLQHQAPDRHGQSTLRARALP
jgi:hypothetical protein